MPYSTKEKTIVVGGRTYLVPGGESKTIYTKHENELIRAYKNAEPGVKREVIKQKLIKVLQEGQQVGERATGRSLELVRAGAEGALPQIGEFVVHTGADLVRSALNRPNNTGNDRNREDFETRRIESLRQLPRNVVKAAKTYVNPNVKTDELLYGPIVVDEHEKREVLARNFERAKRTRDKINQHGIASERVNNAKINKALNEVRSKPMKSNPNSLFGGLFRAVTHHYKEYEKKPRHHKHRK